MNYLIFYASSFILCLLFVNLTGILIGKEKNKNPFLTYTGMAVYSAVPLIFGLSTQSEAKAEQIIIKSILLIIMMLTKAGCLSVIFREISLRMLYISILSFVTSSIYENVMLYVFRCSRMMNNIISPILESICILAVIILIKRKNYFRIAADYIRIIPYDLYITILIFLFLISLFEFTSLSESLNWMANKLVIPVAIMITYIISRIIKISAAEKEKEQTAKLLSVQLKNQIEHYRKINDIYTEFRGFRHDMNNHLICLRSLISESETEKAIKYMDDIEEMSIARIKNGNYDTGNVIADALLSDKNEKAEKYNSHIRFTGFVPTMGITNADLCTILANAADNAIEACAKDKSNDPKEIIIESDIRQGYFLLRISNPIFEKINIKNENRIQTTKSDRQHHGFGLTNIIKTTEKYDGKASVSVKDNRFILETNLLLKPNI